MNEEYQTLLASRLAQYVRVRPLFLSLIRSKEATLFDRYFVMRRPMLDVGCGDGVFADMTFTKKIDVGLDLEKSRINESKKLNIYKQLVTYNGRKIPFGSAFFSTVISNCVLEHIENLGVVLPEIQRVLKSGGYFYTTVMAKEWEEHLFGSLFFGDWYKAWMRKKQVHRNLLTPQEWSKAFKKAGFSVVKQIGYLSPRACRLIDICHYVSLPGLITYTLFGKWVLFPELSQHLYPVRYLTSVLGETIDADQSGALFYVLKKQ